MITQLAIYKEIQFMKQLPTMYNELISAVMDKINAELERLYWNKNQQPLTNSPFSNTGETYSNDTFTVRAYYWGPVNTDEDVAPNFEYPGIHVYWYKHCGRGLTVFVDDNFSVDFLATMLNDCIGSLRRDFGERERGVINESLRSGGYS